MRGGKGGLPREAKEAKVMRVRKVFKSAHPQACFTR